MKEALFAAFAVAFSMMSLFVATTTSEGIASGIIVFLAFRIFLKDLAESFNYEFIERECDRREKELHSDLQRICAEHPSEAFPEIHNVVSILEYRRRRR